MLSIIIVNYNTKKLLGECIKSVLASKLSFSFEIIVVDNGSSDGSGEYLRKLKKENIKIIENKKNLGFGKANNQGMKLAAGEYILLLNSDTKVVGDVIEKAVNWMEKRRQVGVLGCTLLNKDGSIQPSVGYLPRLSKIFLWSLGVSNFPLLRVIFKPYHVNYPSFYEKEAEVGWVTGAFFLLRAEVYEKTGGFDKKLFMYGEEIEWCSRIKKAGFGIYYSPAGAIFHLKGASGAGFGKMIASEYKGLVYYFAKHKAGWEMPILRFLLTVDKNVKYLAYSLLGDKIKASAYGKINSLDR